MVRIRPRSMARYSEEVRIEAREAFLEFSFMSRMGDAAIPAINHTRQGGNDDMPMLQLAAFLINKRGPQAGVLCTGCGSQWSDERLAEEKAKNPSLVSCCPERKVKPVYWCDNE